MVRQPAAKVEGSEDSDAATTKQAQTVVHDVDDYSAHDAFPFRSTFDRDGKRFDRNDTSLTVDLPAG
jgi:hypothetical protein